MNVLYIIKRDLDPTVQKLIETERLTNSVNVVNLYDRSADELLDLISSSDRLIMW